MYSMYLKYWLDLWLTDESKAELQQKWYDKAHPSIVPTDKFYKNPYLR